MTALRYDGPRMRSRGFRVGGFLGLLVLLCFGLTVLITILGAGVSPIELGLIVVFVVAGAFTWIASVQANGRLLQQSASRLAPAHREGSFLGNRVTQTVDGFEWVSGISEGDNRTTPPSISAVATGPFVPLEILPTGTSVFEPDSENRTGDALFDHRFHVRGPARYAFAVLDRETRIALWRPPRHFDVPTLARRGDGPNSPRGHSGALRIRRWGTPGEEAIASVFDVLRTLQSMLRARPESEIVALLQRRILEPIEPVEFRRNALTALVSLAPARSETRLVLRKAASATEPRLRIAALVALGEADDAAQLAGHGDLESDVAIAEALGRMGGPLAERLLLSLLVRIEGEPARLAAVEALGRVGAIDCLPAIRREADRVVGRAAKHVCETAIASIQSRIPGASSGQLH